LTQGTFVKFFNSNAKIRNDDISILTFNTHRSNGIYWSRNPGFGNKIAEFIAKQNSDIVCFQEFDVGKEIEYEQYPYQYLNGTFRRNDRMPQAIYSKYPIVAKGSLNFTETSNNAIYVDVVINEDTLRIYSVHLESLNIRPWIFKKEPSDRLLGRLDKSFQKQLEQALMVRESKDAVPHRSIICGDLNNTQFSSVYNTLKGDMKDSFQELGFGFGSTYDFMFLPFRIDYILADDNIVITAHKNFDVKLSDHTPIMASFRLKD